MSLSTRLARAAIDRGEIPDIVGCAACVTPVGGCRGEVREYVLHYSDGRTAHVTACEACHDWLARDLRLEPAPFVATWRRNLRAVDHTSEIRAA